MYFRITAVATGITAVTGATSARSAIPNASDGNAPRYVRLASRNECYVKIGNSTVTATSNDLLIQPGDAVVLQIPSGITHIAYIQGTAAGAINVTPLENL